MAFLIKLAKHKKKDFNVEFVREFHALTFKHIGTSDLVFDLHELSKWIHMTPGNILHNILKCKKLAFEENVDFKIEENWARGPSNLRYKPIKLTHNTFVSVILMMRNGQGEQARRYYIWLEEALHQYLRGELDKRTARVLELESHLKAKNSYKAIEQKESMIYVFPATEIAKDVFRLGQTTSFLKRMRSHNSPRASPILPVWTLKTSLPVCVEGVTKYALKPLQYEKLREVYMVPIKVLKSILVSAAEICKSVKNEADRVKLGEYPLSTDALGSGQEGGADDVKKILRHIHRSGQDPDAMWFVYYSSDADV